MNDLQVLNDLINHAKEDLSIAEEENNQTEMLQLESYLDDLENEQRILF